MVSQRIEVAGSSITATAEVAREAEKLLAGDKDLIHATTYIGQGSRRFWLGFNLVLPNEAFAQIVILSRDVEARERLKAKLEGPVARGALAAARVRVYRFNFGPPVVFPVQFRAVGSDPAEVRKIAYRVREVMSENKKAIDPHLDWNEMMPSIRLVVDQDRARAFGLDPSSIAQSLQTLISGVPVTVIHPDDKTVIGNGLPDFSLGINNSFTFGDFDFNFFLRGEFGHDLINSFRTFYEPLGSRSIENLVVTEYFNENLTATPAFNSYYVEDASFIALDNATLGYTLNLPASSSFKRLRLYLSAQNLFFITNYSGVDPSVRYADPGGSDNGGFAGREFNPDPLYPGHDRRKIISEPVRSSWVEPWICAAWRRASASSRARTASGDSVFPGAAPGIAGLSGAESGAPQVSAVVSSGSLMVSTFTNFCEFGKEAFTNTAKLAPQGTTLRERPAMSYLKAAGLMLLTHVAFAAVGWSIAGREGALIATLVALGFHILVFWYAEKIVLKLHNAREDGSDDPSPMIRAFVADCDRLAMRANMPRPRTYIVDAFQPNAFVAGRDTNHASIAVTDGLLKTLTRAEVSAVVAHELAHVKRGASLCQRARSEASTKRSL